MYNIRLHNISVSVCACVCVVKGGPQLGPCSRPSPTWLSLSRVDPVALWHPPL